MLVIVIITELFIEATGGSCPSILIFVIAMLHNLSFFSYIRMVEPLVIAEYYSCGGKEYETKNRPRHFAQLEEW